jgi:hypothetical protein
MITAKLILEKVLQTLARWRGFGLLSSNRVNEFGKNN